MTGDTERTRKAKKLIETLEAFALLCKQIEPHVRDMAQLLTDEIKAESEANRGAEKVLGEAPGLGIQAKAPAQDRVQSRERNL